MNYQQIFKDDLINGEGVRCSLFVSGCSHGCKGCFSEQSWNPKSGEVLTPDIIEDLFNSIDKPYVDGLSLLGGDPLMSKNVQETIELCTKFKERFPDKTIWCWTGYVLEEVQSSDKLKPILDLIDVLVDGKFQQDLKDLSLPFRGSSNQRILRKGIDF